MSNKCFKETTSNPQKKNPKKTKAIQKRNKPSSPQYAQHQYQELDEILQEDLIVEQKKLLNYVEQVQEEAKKEEIQVIPIRQAKKDAFNYKYKELYLVQHEGQGEDNLHLVYDWEPCQSSIKSFPLEQQEEYKKAFREGKMLEPIRKVYATDRQLEIFRESVQSTLTDGIVNLLRQKYLAGYIPKNLTVEMKNLLSQFVKYPPQYCLKLLNLDLPIVIKEFRETHSLPLSIDIQTKPDKPANNKASLFLRFSSLPEYLNIEKYFIDMKKFEVLTVQHYNKTREVLKALEFMHQQDMELVQPDQINEQESQMILEENNAQKTTEKEIADSGKAFREEKSASYEKKSQLQPIVVNTLANQEKDQLNKVMSIQLNNEIDKISIDMSQPSLEKAAKEAAIEDQILETTSKIDSIIKASKKKIKQIINLNNQKLSIGDLLRLYSEQAVYIHTCKQSCQLPDRIILTKFLEQYSLKSVNNYLTAVCADYKIQI